MQKILKYIKPVMKSSENKKRYEEMIMNKFDEQNAELKRRVENNLIHQATVTKEIVEKIKQDIKEENRKTESTTELYCKAEPKYLVAIQVRSQCGISPKPKKTMQLLRLSKINQCVILKNNECIRNMLQIVKDYVAFGFVEYELLRKLVYLRGYGKIGRNKVKLTNENIENAFDGKYRCVEELLAVIYYGSEDMKKVLNFLVPLKLNTPKRGYSKKNKIKTFIQGGATNNHHELLGELLEKML